MQIVKLTLNPVDLPNLQAMPSGEAALAAVSAHAVLTGACCDSHAQVWSWVKVALCSKRLSGCASVDPQGALVFARSWALRRWWTRVSVREYREAQQALARAVMGMEAQTAEQAAAHLNLVWEMEMGGGASPSERSLASQDALSDWDVTDTEAPETQ